MHTIGAGFTNTSKAGTKYLTLQLFRPSKEEVIKILAFPKKSKSGNPYLQVVLPDGVDALEKLKDHLQKHIDAQNKTKDNSDLVETIF